jgi:hypothetical protein
MPKEIMMRFYHQPHRFYGGIDLHASTMYLCSLDQGGHIVCHQVDDECLLTNCWLRGRRARHTN